MCLLISALPFCHDGFQLYKKTIPPFGMIHLQEKNSSEFLQNQA